MSQSTNSNEQPSLALPIIAIVLSVLGCTWPIGLVLGIIAVVKYSKYDGSSAKTLSIVSLVLPIVFVPVIGIMAAIAIPNFVKFQCRAKQSEAKGNLKALYVAEESNRAQFDTYSNDLAKIEFTPRGAKIRYDYVVDSADKQHFHATAHVRPEFKGEVGDDTWQITDANDVTNTLNGCN